MASTYKRVHAVHGTLTLAQINASTRAGTLILAAAPGRTYTVVDTWMRALGGNAGGATAVILTDETPTTITSTTAGTLTQNTVVRMGVSGCTSTNVGTAMAGGKGLRIGCTVADLTTCTGGIEYYVEYLVTS